MMDHLLLNHPSIGSRNGNSDGAANSIVGMTLHATDSGKTKPDS